MLVSALADCLLDDRDREADRSGLTQLAALGRSRDNDTRGRLWARLQDAGPD